MPPAAERRDTGESRVGLDTSAVRPRWAFSRSTVRDQRRHIHGPGQYFGHGPADDACLRDSPTRLGHPASSGHALCWKFPADAWATVGGARVLACALVWWSLCTVLDRRSGPAGSRSGRHRAEAAVMRFLLGVESVVLRISIAVMTGCRRDNAGIGIAIQGHRHRCGYPALPPPGSW